MHSCGAGHWWLAPAKWGSLPGNDLAVSRVLNCGQTRCAVRPVGLALEPRLRPPWPWRPLGVPAGSRCPTFVDDRLHSILNVQEFDLAILNLRACTCDHLLRR